MLSVFQILKNLCGRTLDIILPGNFDNYFVELHNLYDDAGQADETQLNELAAKYGIRYL